MLSKQVKQRIAFNKGRRSIPSWMLVRHRAMNDYLLTQYCSLEQLPDKVVASNIAVIATMDRQEFREFQKTGIVPEMNRSQRLMKRVLSNITNELERGSTHPILVVDSLGQL